MLEFSKRWGPYFFSAFILLVLGMVQLLYFLKDYPVLVYKAFIIFSILAIICLFFTIIALFYDLMDARKRDGKQNIIDHSFNNWMKVLKSHVNRPEGTTMTNVRKGA